MAYVYRHIRLDKNEPFYIGIGGDDKYQRSKTKMGRNKYWNNITSKTNFSVDILIDELTWEDACKKEVEFISLYKRRKEGGTLCNLTFGGEGQKGMIHWNLGKETSIDTKLKQSIKKIGKPSPRKGCKVSQHVIDSMRKGLLAKGPWNKGVSTPRETVTKWKETMKDRIFVSPMKGKNHSEEQKEKWIISRKGDIPWNKGKKGQYTTRPSKLKKSVIQYSMDMRVINEFDSATGAARETGSKKAGISKCCLGQNSFHNGFKWRYK